MELWQLKYITDNLQALIRMTNCNTTVQAILKAEMILTDADISSLEAAKNTKGCIDQSAQLYNLLVGRELAFEKLTKALHETHQSDAVKILLEGLSQHGIRTPLTHCGIQIVHDHFKETEILAYGRSFNLKDFFPNVDTSNFQKLFHDSLPEHFYYEYFIKKKEFQLVNNTIPPEPGLYVPRYLSNRIKINIAAFQYPCSDVFVFKGIERYELTKLAKPNYTSSSKTQLDCLSSRFIYLDRDEDWTTILEIATVPVHLINYETSDDTYILENTSGNSDVLFRFCSEQDRAYIKEDEFIERQISKNSNGVCICDTPGMGKTMLLASIARKLVQKRPTTITAFISLSNFVESLPSPLPNIDQNLANVLLHVIEYVTPHKEAAILIAKLVEKGLLQMHLLFDGFDEITPQQVEWMKQIFILWKATFPAINIYVTSRPHMRHDLETSMKAVAYDIRPFDIENQADFLTNSWLSRFFKDLRIFSRRSALKIYALRVLEVVQNTLSVDEKCIAGIPLLCEVIASAYKKEAEIYSSMDSSEEIRCPPRTICEMYKNFIQTKIVQYLEALPVNSRDAKNLKLVHTFHAWKLIFPENVVFENLEDLHETNFDKSMICKVGIMQQRFISNTAKMGFVHRTFAEYLVADYIANNLQSGNLGNTKHNILLQFVFTKVFDCKEKYRFLYYDKSFFIQSVIVYFLNSLLCQQNGFFITETQNKLIFMTLPARSIYVTLSSCCEKGYINILFLIKRFLMSFNPTAFDEYNETFTPKKCFKLMSLAVVHTNFQFFLELLQLISEVFRQNMEDICQRNNDNKTKDSLLQEAVACAKYEIVVFLIDKTSCKSQSLLEKCVAMSYYQPFDANRLSILTLLIDTDNTLIKECPYLVMTTKMHLNLLIPLIKFGAPIDSTKLDKPLKEEEENCVKFAATYMSPSDFHHLIEFLLIHLRAQDLFCKPSEHNDTLHYIVANVTVLPKTFDMLLSIPCVDLNMLNKKGDNLAFWAVLGNKIDNLQELVKRGIEYSCTGCYKDSLFHLAAEYGFCEIISYLRSIGLDPNQLNSKGDTPLFVAAEYSDVDTVRALVENGADCSVLNKQQMNLLHIAAKTSNAELISFCASQSLDLNHMDKFGETPVLEAANQFVNDIAIVKQLIDLGADYTAVNNDGVTILHYAAKNDNSELAEYCIKLGLNPDQKDNYENTPILDAAMDYSFKVIQTLKNLGADFNVTNDYNENILHIAADTENLKLVRYCLEIGISPNLRDDGGSTPILTAADNEDMPVIQALISAGADVNIVDKGGMNMLHKAAKTKNQELIQFCLNLGLNANQSDNYGFTPLLNAAAEKDSPSCRKLIELGADYNHVNIAGWDTACFAAKTENLELLNYLLELGYNPNKINRNGDAAIFVLAENCNDKAMQLFVQIGADPKCTNSNGQNLLHIAAKTNNTGLISYLVTQGLSVNQQDNDGNTPVFLASLFGEVKCVWTLIEAGADHKLANRNGQNIFHVAARRANTKLIYFCMHLKMSPNQWDVNENTPFHLAAESCSSTLITEMIRYGADPNILNNEGQNLMHIAAKSSNYQLIPFCQKFGINPNQGDSNGDTPIFLGAKYANINTVHKLVLNGADLKSTNTQGQSLLHVAAEEGKPEIVYYCLCHGLNPNQRDNDGDTPLFLAAYYGNVETVRLLIKSGGDYNLVNKYGQNILNIAADWLHKDLVLYCVKELFGSKNKTQLSTAKKIPAINVENFKAIDMETQNVTRDKLKRKQSKNYGPDKSANESTNIETVGIKKRRKAVAEENMET